LIFLGGAHICKLKFQINVLFDFFKIVKFFIIGDLIIFMMFIGKSLFYG